MTRPLLLGAAWSASAAAAVGLGFLAVSLVDASASPDTVDAGATGAVTPTGTSASSAPPAAQLPTGEFATVGGTVYADCSTGSPVLAGAPAAGWSADDSPDPGEVEFESGSQKVEVQVSCVGGVPSFVLDDSSSAGSAGATPADDSPGTGPSAPTTSGGGSDDPPGDDHGGGSGGGSDDGSGSGSGGSGSSGGSGGGSDDPAGDDHGGGGSGGGGGGGGGGGSDDGGGSGGGHGSDD